jgi:hypothetical protein
MASPKTAAVASVYRASSSPSFPRSSGDAGEAVEVVRPVSSVLASLAGRGGEGRSWWLVVIRFWCLWWRWFSSSACLLWLAVAAWGAAAGGSWVQVVVGPGGASSAGRWAVLGRWCCGRARSSRLGSVARRRTALAAIYDMWRCSFPGGSRYGDGGEV